VRTDHVLFIAAGRFHVAKPSDLIPELQGRFPIRVELTSLGARTSCASSSEPRNSLVRQYLALLETEGRPLEFRDDGSWHDRRSIAAQVERRTEDIGGAGSTP
jgi:ATP-dependent HslUV protease ATP-binding subunit HslU